MRTLIKAASKLSLFLLRGKWCADCLMIDGLVGHCGEHLTNLWKRDEGGTGQYPPPTLHVSSNLYHLSAKSLWLFILQESVFQPLVLQALLDIYLLDNIDEAAKHAIVSLSGEKLLQIYFADQKLVSE